MATHRFLQLEKHLLRSEELMQRYSTGIQEYFDLNQIVSSTSTEEERFPATSTNQSAVTACVLPHHAVIREDKLTTKLRIVFDASSKTSNGKSLNDILCIGPALQNELPAVILNWRFYEFVFNADVQKMYRCIDMHPDDIPYQKIVWRDNKRCLQEYCLTTVTFSTASAPCTAISVIHRIADDEKQRFPLAENVLKEEMYVDDVQSGGYSLESAIKKRDQGKAALASAGMELRKWASNHPVLLESIPLEHQYSGTLLELHSDEVVKTLAKTASHRQYRYRPDYLQRYDDNEFIKRFRLSKPTFRYCSISPRTKLMLALRFYASGSFLITVGDFCGVSVSTASRAVKEVSFALAALYKDFIQLPSDPTQTVAEFFQIAKFPKVIGVIDCTHVRVQSPGGGNAEIFRNRKGYFSINVQAMCNANLMFLDLVVRWPGSAHDYNIFRNSRLKFCMEEGHFSNYFILGDSGYKQTHYLMTPLVNPSNAPERLYNESQIRTRISIERCFGVWKRRFPVLSIGLRISINSTMAVIVACGVLHNIAVLSKDPLPPMDELSLLEIPEDAAENNSVEINSNSVARNRLIQNYFARL
ncbi:PREDICTED: uncharacterized protein LOC108368072 [Rhagoletis zephyria]|uniref:uncharacterized protein LOC108368072 n=1 Tax=Rhagoletis zephyria TaxID=28612 RepID=UPI00081126FF|nr:PREDICTED: uncharacterized protein LOC108368072 [Rhagoletis zephyria]